MFKIFKVFRELKNSIKESEEKRRHYREMPSSELGLLNDQDLYEAILARTEEKVGYDDIAEGMKALSHAEKAFYVTSYYEMEVNNGGLCQFFVNSSHDVAPFLAECLGEIGAKEHQKLFESFIKKNKIDVNALMSLDADNYEDLLERYPFDSFDDKFYELKPISDYLAPFAREHLSEF